MGNGLLMPGQLREVKFDEFVTTVYKRSYKLDSILCLLKNKSSRAFFVQFIEFPDTSQLDLNNHHAERVREFMLDSFLEDLVRLVSGKRT